MKNQINEIQKQLFKSHILSICESSPSDYRCPNICYTSSHCECNRADIGKCVQLVMWWRPVRRLPVMCRLEYTSHKVLAYQHLDSARFFVALFSAVRTLYLRSNNNDSHVKVLSQVISYISQALFFFHFSAQWIRGHQQVKINKIIFPV